MIVAASESIIFSGWKDANLFANYSLFFLLAGSMLILLEGTARKEPIRKDSDGKN
jgi:hypothetical protein